MKIRFTIHGNSKDPAGNPVPYKRLIRGSFRRGDSDYLEWQEYVRARFYRTAELILTENDLDPRVELPDILIDRDAGNIVGLRQAGHGVEEKPINIPGYLMQLDLDIRFKDGHHGDPDNVFKSIADALFVQDKNLYGTFPIPQPSTRGSPGRVDAVLTITNRKQ